MGALLYNLKVVPQINFWYLNRVHITVVNGLTLYQHHHKTKLKCVKNSKLSEGGKKFLLHRERELTL